MSSLESSALASTAQVLVWVDYDHQNLDTIWLQTFECAGLKMS